jgi:hypothetical protein
MFIVGFFAGLLFLLVIDLVAGTYQKYKSHRDYARNSK